MIISFELIWLFKIVYLLSWYILIPGVALSFILYPKTSFIIKVGNSFAFGFVVFTIISFWAYLFTWSLNLIHISYYIINPGFILICFIQNSLRIKTLSPLFQWKKLNKTIFTILIISILGFIFSLFSGWMPRGDAAIHLQVIKNIVYQDIVSQPFYSLIGNPIMPDHAYDTYYILIALITKYSGIELSIVWHYLSPILSLLLPFSLYSFLKSLTNDKKLIAFSLVGFYFLAVFYPLLMYGTVYDALVYPNRVYLWLILPIALAFAFKYVETKKYLDLFIAPIIVCSLLLIHQNGFIFYFLILFGTYLTSLLYLKSIKLDRKRILINLLLTLIVSAPILILKLGYNMDYIKESSSEIWHQHYQFYYLSENLFAFSFKAYFKLGMLVSIILITGLLFTIKKDTKNALVKLVLAASFIFSLLIIYNPILVPFLGKTISFVAINRMQRAPLFFILIGFIIYYSYCFIKKRTTHKVFNTLKITSAVSILLIAIIVSLIKVKDNNIHHEMPLVSEFNSILEENSIILSDPLTSTDIVEFIDVTTVVIQFNGAADLINIDSEKADVDKILNQEITVKEAKNILIKYNIDYIIVNSDIVEPKLEFNNHSIFEEIYNKDNYRIIKFIH
jgi:hypothetical protein